MNDGVRITNNNNTSTMWGAFGGGVAIHSGTFIMNGGEITGNRAGQGGGVLIWTNLESSPVFTMNGGYITNNIATSDGGGVCIVGESNPRAFTITNGTISGNSASGNGDGLFIAIGSTFNDYGGRINDAIFDAGDY
jgi:hypothetical protein